MHASDSLETKKKLETGKATNAIKPRPEGQVEISDFHVRMLTAIIRLATAAPLLHFAINSNVSSRRQSDSPPENTVLPKLSERLVIGRQ